MHLLCIGDIAISDKLHYSWPLPIGIMPENKYKILFNWELPIGTSIKTVPRTSGPRLLSHPASVDVIQRWAPSFAALANNHVLDAGEEGLLETKSALHQAGFQTVGAGQSTEEIQKPLFWETDEGRLAIFNWVFPETHPECDSVPGPNCWPGTKTAEMIIQDLKDQADWVMAFVHWSDELFSYPRPEDRMIGYALAQMGVDIIIGHHPHVVRGMEIIGTSKVFYSLGNYFFSDTLDKKTGLLEKSAPRNRESLGILVTFTKGEKVGTNIFSFWQRNGIVVQDKYHRAERRMLAVSRSLRQISGAEYYGWYKRKRDRFNSWGYRWHFRLRQIGIIGLFKYFVRRKFLSS